MTALIVTIPCIMMTKEYLRDGQKGKMWLTIVWGVVNSLIGLAATISVLLKMINGQ